MIKKLLLLMLCVASVLEMSAYKRSDLTLLSNGKQRKMVVFVPDQLPDNSPLFITTHGMNQDPGYQLGSDKMYEMIDTAKFVMVYPQSDGSMWDTGGTNDQDFICNIINDMVTRYKIDKYRVYWSGFSMGSMLIHHCIANMQDKIAAFAPTSGIQFTEQPWNNCKKPVRLLEVIAYGDDVFGYEAYGVHGYVENYAKHDQHPNYKKITGYRVPGGAWFDGDLERWWGGPNGGEVMMYSYNNGGHWPNDCNPRLLWAFCKRYSLNDPNAPTATFLNPTEKTKISVGDTVNVKIQANDKDGTIASIYFYIDGKLKGRKIFKAADKPKDGNYIYEIDWAARTAGEHSLSAIATDNDNKTREIYLTVKVTEPDAAVVQTADPENHSFDLPVTTSQFQFTFNYKVDPTTAVATLKTTAGTINLQAQGLTKNTVLTLVVPEGSTIGEGAATLTISSLTDEHKLNVKSFKYNYTFGVTEVTEKSTGTSDPVKYKKPYIVALNAAKALYDETGTEAYADAVEALRAPLKEILDKYESWSSTSPTEYEAATKELTESVTALTERKALIDKYYSLHNQLKELSDKYASHTELNQGLTYQRLMKYYDSYDYTASDLKNITKTNTAISRMEELIERFLALVATGIDTISTDQEVSSVKYYDMSGHQIAAPVKGITIQKITLKNGQTITRKQLYK